jgi:hypothetical protein
VKITDAIHEFILYKQSLGMSYKNRALKLNAFARLAGPSLVTYDRRTIPPLLKRWGSAPPPGSGLIGGSL